MPPLRSWTGVRIFEDPTLVDVVEDWSRVRSPARARRRRAKGYRQNITFIETPKREAYFLAEHNAMVMHPSVAARMHEHIGKLSE